MTEPNLSRSAGGNAAAVRRLQRRYRAERRFRLYGIAAIASALLFLAVLLVTIVVHGASAFVETRLLLPISFDAATLDPDRAHDKATLSGADYRALVNQGLVTLFPELADDRALSAPADQLFKGKVPHNSDSGLSDATIARLDALQSVGKLRLSFNRYLFTAGDSRQPELAGLLGAIVGSFYALIITIGLSFPLGVAAAVYLEEFADKNRFTDLIEVNIKNLAAVPSIVFGLLALEIFLNVLGLPRSAPLVGGLALTLVSLPTIIISARVALKAVPPWIREAAQGLGASRQQMVLHHVLPLAMPGILTGTIIAMARAIGESAPLLMIGMVAFVVDIPATPLDPATALPVQIYLWAASPERAFVERTSAAIIVLLACLVVMNATAIYLRKKFERRW